MIGIPLARRSRTRRRPSASVVALAVAVALLAASCGDDSSTSTDGDGSSGEAMAGPVSGDAVDGDDAPAASTDVDPHGTVEIDGQIHELTLDPSGNYNQCTIDESSAMVVGMIAPGDVEVSVAGGDIWSASVLGPGTEWVAASDDPSIGSDVTREISAGHLVLSGTWVPDDGSSQTADVRVELTCPTSG